MNDDTTTFMSDALDHAMICWMMMTTRRTLGANNPKFQESLSLTCESLQCIIDNSTPMDWTEDEIQWMLDAVDEITAMKTDERYAHLFAED